MKQIKILLSSALTLLLITGNHSSYAAPHYTDFNGGKFQGKKPSTNAFKGQVRKGNRYVPDGRNDGIKRMAMPIGVPPEPKFNPPKPYRTGTVAPLWKFRECSALAKGQGSGIECKVPSSFNAQEGGTFIPSDTYMPTDTQGNLKRPKGVQLKFIDGEWK